LPADFFDKFHELLAEVHRRDIAYIDLHKRENVLVGDDGLPYLFDFQISYAPPRGFLRRLFPSRWVLRLLQRSDDYHLAKHCVACQGGAEARTPYSQRRRPWWIRLHRLIARPFRSVRRRILVLANVRSSKGRVGTEWFAEAGLQQSP
jgi:hypothetical protein